MASITETLSGLQDQVLDLMKTVQEPAVDAVEKVVETVEGFLPEDRPAVPFADSLLTVAAEAAARQVSSTAGSCRPSSPEDEIAVNRRAAV